MIYYTGTDERGVSRSGHIPACGFANVIKGKHRRGWTALTASRNGVTLASIAAGRLTFAAEVAQ